MKTITRVAVLALVFTAGICVWGRAAEPASEKSSTPATSSRMKIIIKTEQRELAATLDDNATAKAFAQLLPLDLSLEDFNRKEKIGYLPRKLPTPDASPDVDGAAGELAYYAPWGNLAIFYHDFRYSSGLFKLGRLDAGADEFRGTGGMKIRIELAKESSDAR